MSETCHPAPAGLPDSIDRVGYEEAYRRSVADPEGYWRDEARRVDWIRPFTVVKDTSFD